MKRDLSEILVVVRGAGELGTAVACALWRSYVRTLLLELAQPTTPAAPVFARAVTAKQAEVEGIWVQKAEQAYEFPNIWGTRRLPLFIDPRCEVRGRLRPDVIVDARDGSAAADGQVAHATLLLAVGRPAAIGKEVHGAVGTGRTAGMVHWAPRTPEPHVGRVVAEADGVWQPERAAGERVVAGAVLGRLGGKPMATAVEGLLRGVRPAGTAVGAGEALAQVGVGDEAECPLDRVTVAARATAGGVLEALLAVFNQVA